MQAAAGSVGAAPRPTTALERMQNPLSSRDWLGKRGLLLRWLARSASRAHSRLVLAIAAIAIDLQHRCQCVAALKPPQAPLPNQTGTIRAALGLQPRLMKSGSGGTMQAGPSISTGGDKADLEAQESEEERLLHLSPRTRAVYMSRTQSTSQVRAPASCRCRRRRRRLLPPAAACCLLAEPARCPPPVLVQAAQSILGSYISRRFMSGW